MTIPNSLRTIYGNLTVPTSGGTLTAGANTTTLAGASTQSITTNARTIDFPITVGNGTSTGVAQLASALTLGSTRTFTLTSGNFDLNNFTTTANVFVANGTASRILSFSSSGQLTLVGSGGTIISMPTATGFSYSGTPKILSSYSAGTGTRTFALGNAAAISVGNTFNFNINGSNAIVIAGGTDTLTVLGQVTDFDLRNSTNILTNDVRTVYGNFYTSATGGTFTAGANTTTLAGYSGSFTIDTANRVLDFPVSIDGNGNFTLSNSYICGSSGTVSTRAFTLTTGNLTLSNTVIYTGQFVTTSSNIRSIVFTGTLPTIQLMNTNTTVWNSNIGTNFTWSGSLQVNSTYTSNVGTRVFDFGTIAEAYAPNVKITTGTAGFNLNTANDIVTLTGAIGTLDLTGLASTLTITNTARTIYGNLTIPATGGTFTAGAVATTFGATSGTKTIDTANRALAFPITFNGVGGNWTLANGLAANATTVLTLTNGQVNFNQKTLTFANITVLTGNAGLSNLNTTLAIVHTSGNLTTVSGAITSTTTNTYAIASGTLSANAAFTTAAFTLTNGNVIANATLTTTAFTHTAGNLTTNTGGSANTQAYTIAAGNITLASGGDLTCTTFTTTGTTAKNFQFGGNINVTSTGTVFSIGSTTNLTASGSGNVNVTNAGSTPITVTPSTLAEANAINFNFVAGTYALTLTSTAAVDNLNFTGFAGTLANTTLTVYGNLTLSTGMTWTGGTGVLTFSGANDQSLTSSTKTIDSPVTVNKTGGVLSIADTANIGNTRAFTLTAGNLTANASLTTGAFTHTAGTMTANAAVNTLAYTLTAGNMSVLTGGSVNTLAYTQNGGNVILNGGDLVTTTFTSNSGTTRTITFTNGNINATSTGTVINMANTTALTSSATIGNINITNAGSTAITITPGALAQANAMNYNITGGTYALTISNANAVRNLNFTGFAGSLADTAANIYGNLTLAAGMTVTSSANALTFTGTLDQNLISSGVTIDKPITVNKTGGVLSIADTANIGNTRAFILTAGNLTANASLTTGAFTHTAGNMTANAAVNTLAYTQNGGNIILTGSDLTATTLTSNNSTTRSIQLGTSNINVTSNGTVVNMTTTTGLTANGTGNIQITSAGSTAITVTPGALAEANAINYNFTGGTYALTLTAGNVENLNFTGFAGTVGDSAMTIFGNLVFSAGMTRTAGTGTYTFAKTSTQYITSNGKTFDFPVTINGASGTVTLNDSLTVGSTRLTTLTNGNLDLNGFTYTTGTFSTAAGTKGIIFDGGTFIVTGSGATAFNNANPTGFTTSAGTGSGTISLTSATAKTFVGGSFTYNATLSHNGTGALTITGNNTFDDLSSPITSSSATSLILTAGTTQNLGNFSAAGQATRLLSINSTANTTPATDNMATLNYTGSSYVSTDYISVYEIEFTSSGYNDGTSYLKWYVGTGSNNIRNIRGALFTAGTPATQKVYLLETGSTWTVPSDFNPSNNQIYLYGGGGGGGGSHGTVSTGGGGGGGGGFTLATNYGLYSPASASYTVGAGGTGGLQNNGSSGGTTFFSSLYANGGGGGQGLNGSGTTNLGGTGGVGLTYNGGKGGQAGPVGATNVGGGGTGAGGGSGGIYGNGGNGGAAPSGSYRGGGGGGGSGGGTNGGNGTATLGGAGGNNFQGQGGGTGGNSTAVTSGVSGALGGGGGGSGGSSSGIDMIGALGSYGIDLFGSLGGGGGAGGGYTTATNSNGVTGYGYGSGGGGGGYDGGAGVGRGGKGGNGVIIIYYVPSSYVQWPNNMFLLF
jgi:hypothetical protein